MSNPLQANLTYDILTKAEHEGYGVLAQTWCVQCTYLMAGIIYE